MFKFNLTLDWTFHKHISCHIFISSLFLPFQVTLEYSCAITCKWLNWLRIIVSPWLQLLNLCCLISVWDCSVLWNSHQLLFCAGKWTDGWIIWLSFLLRTKNCLLFDKIGFEIVTLEVACILQPLMIISWSMITETSWVGH